jgi:adenylate cyclase
MDMVLLLGLIWSFHIQYRQPASFYLKAPTLLYVFIFIALRTLHFEVRYVVLAGSVAAAGWLVMVWYVIGGDFENPMITRDYVEYMTSNSVLLGAEFDKVITILMVTGILAVAMARARGLLVKSVVGTSAARDLSRFVPTEVAEQITSSDERVEAGQGEVREATILFTDIEGFTSIGEALSPTELITTLNEYFAVVSEPIERYGGAINQFQGDAILASFNLPKAHPDHAANAVHAALEIQHALKDKTFGPNITLNSRIGVNSGVVVGGMVGTGQRLGYTVHGDDVNLAARLEQMNRDYGTRILVAERTRELAGQHRFAFREIGYVQARGRSHPTIVYTLASEGRVGGVSQNPGISTSASSG